MSEYRVVFQDIPSVINRDLPKAVEGLQSQVDRWMGDGWKTQGGLTTVQAGGGRRNLRASGDDP